MLVLIFSLEIVILAYSEFIHLNIKKQTIKTIFFSLSPKKAFSLYGGGGARTLGICPLQIEVTIDGIDAFPNDVRFLCCKNLPPSLRIADFGISYKLLKEKYKTYLVVLLHCVM